MRTRILRHREIVRKTQDILYRETRPESLVDIKRRHQNHQRRRRRHHCH